MKQQLKMNVYAAPSVKVKALNLRSTVCTASTGGFDPAKINDFGSGDDDWD